MARYRKNKEAMLSYLPEDEQMLEAKRVTMLKSKPYKATIIDEGTLVKDDSDERLAELNKKLQQLKGDVGELDESAVSGMAEDVTSEGKKNASHKAKFSSYAEIEEELGVDTSDAQAFASAHPELLEGDLKKEVEEVKQTVKEGMAKEEAKEEKTEETKPQDLSAKHLEAVLDWQTKMKKHTLETAIDTEEALKELVNEPTFAGKTYSRKEMIETLGVNSSLTTRAMESTKGGKTGKGSLRWKKNVAWAIQKLKKSGELTKVGRNQYTPASASPSSVPASKAKRGRKPKSVIIQASSVQVTPEQVIGSQAGVTERAIQPEAQPGASKPPVVVERVVHSEKESKSPRMARSIDTNNVMVTKKVGYITNPAVDDIIDAHFKDSSNMPLLFIGPAGIGKTIAIEAYAQKNKIPLIEVQATPDTSDDQLLGHSTLINGEVVFQYGSLPKAVEAANKYGSAILLIDEINLLKPEYQTNLNPLTDYRKEIPINETKEKFELQPGKKLLVIGTMNPSSYAATNQMQEALRNRFTEVIVDYPSLPTEKRILKAKTGIMDDDLIGKLILVATFTRNNGQGHPEISTRTLENTLRNYVAYKAVFKDDNTALRKAIENSILSKYYEEPDYQAEVKRKFNDSMRGIKGFGGFD